MNILYKYSLQVFLIVSIFVTSGCLRSSSEEYAIKQLRNDSEVAKSAQYPGGVSPDDALRFIAYTSDAAANKIDPDHEIQATSTAQQIVDAEKIKQPGQQNTELVKISNFVSQGPQGFGAIGWASILGFGAMAAGFVGKFMGPPFNIIGSSIQMVAQRCLPNYDANKKAAVGAITSVDVLLSNFDDVFSALDPDAKEKLKAQCGGKDPVDWAKSVLSDAQHDLGYQDDVSNLITEMKKNIKTKGGYLAVDDVGADAFVKKHV